MAHNLEIQSPKINRQSQSNWSKVFPYYAGYPEAFAAKIISSASLPKDAVILDPWNGSGTTTFAASELGFSAFGLDINPVMVIVSRARTLPASEADALLAICAEISRQVYSNHIACLEDDPLLDWFELSTANRIRTLEATIRKLLIGELVMMPHGVNFEKMSGISAAFYVAMFNVVRHISADLRTSNPTWLRKPTNQKDKIYFDGAHMIEVFNENVSYMAKALAGRLNNSSIKPGNVCFRVADTTEGLQISDIDLVITSPPYCTRIDYTAVTCLQLAVLHPLNGIHIEHLSRRMVGSIRVPEKDLIVSPDWGSKCAQFLKQVKQHHSKASNGYYYKTHIDYYDKMYRSIFNISAAMKPGALAILVVQDSYYKDIHNDVPSIIAEFAEHNGLKIERKEKFVVRRSMSGIHRHKKNYRLGSSTIEAVICARKSG